MNEEKLNLSIRKFLKGVGINSQRIIENKVRNLVEKGQINNSLNAKVTVKIVSPELNIDESINGEIEVDLK
tara:strand:+ start:66 stop:278 length:213 start_codon:yes stop_codon:yes gene_type:complete